MNPPAGPDRVPEPKPPRKRWSALSRVLLSLIGFGAVAGVAGGAAALYGYQQYNLPGPLTAKTVFEIPRGLGTPEIAGALEDAGIISDARVFAAITYLKGARGHLKAGEYAFAAAAPMREVMALIESGKSITYKLSVPEGWTSAAVVARVAENTVLTGEVTAPPAEGAVLPDTYVFKRGLTRQKMIDDMEQAQARLLDELWAARNPSIPLKSKEEAVILASIVERETAVAEERPKIASVFYNRLSKGMRLQSDPTIIYGLTGGKAKLDRPLTRADIIAPTPYNTYTINGLPPGPIANPGRAALEAVLNPPSTGYLYFVADGSGGHAFATTLAEHNKNVAAWRKINAEAATAMEAPEEPPASAGTVAPAAETANGTPGTAQIPEPDATSQTGTEPAAPTAPEPGAASPEPDTAAKAKPADLTAAADFKPGSVIRSGKRLIPIPKNKPKR